MRKFFVYFILILILAIIIARSGYDLSILLEVKPADIAMLSLLLLLSYLNTFFAVSLQFKMLGVAESKKTITYLCLASNLLNYLPAKGGMLSMGTYLKMKRNVPLNKFAFSTFIIYCLVTAVTLLLSLLFLFDEKMAEVYDKIDFRTIILSVILLIGISYLLFLIARKNRQNAISRYYLMFIGNREIITRNKMLFLYLTLNIIAGISLFSLRMYISFAVSGLEISMYHAFLIGIIANLSFFLSFTPGGLGIKEGFIAAISFLLFGRAEVGVIASLFDRAVNLVLTVLTGSYAIKKLDDQLFTKTNGESK
jgi:uncharacterized membrane protein YbhN (UPF0104 family)